MEKTIRITEDYVSFETAKLLKEKGFYGECMSMYVTPKPHAGMGNPNEAKIAPHGRDSHYYDGYLYQCEAPTLQMAMKWLREVHNLHIMVDCIGAKNYMPTIQFTRNSKDIEIKSKISKIGGNGFDSHEQAIDAAIKYCLENLI